MAISENISQYLNNKGKYKDWKNAREINEQKKIAYLKANPIPTKDREKDIKRAKAVLSAVNTMDEFSQAKAEEMEQVTMQVQNAVAQTSTYAGLGLGALTLWLTKSFDAASEVFKGNFKNIKKVIPAGIAAIVPTALGIIATTFWGAKKEILASRLGRSEAMTQDLSSVNQFAVLTDEQEKEAINLSKDISVSKHEIKRSTNAGKGLGIVSSLKTIFKPDKKLTTHLKENTEQVDNEIKKATDIQLTEEETIQAKKDKELVQNIVEKIDIKSQDYAENAELITGTLSAVALGSGGLLGVLTNKVLKSLKVAGDKAKSISLIFGFVASCAGVLMSTKVQKQASRVGRYVAKKELLNNPESIIYVDEEKYKNSQPKQAEKKKDGFISKTIKLFKDHKEYTEYIKNNRENNAKLRKAIDKIKLSDSQISEAKQLQHNVFKMFNKVDEKSQAFSESIEATGESATSLLSLIMTLPSMFFYGKSINQTGKGRYLNILKSCLSLIPTILFSVLLTKEQKKASRVADMLAIKELNDYRHFAPEEKYKDSSAKKVNALSNEKINFDSNRQTNNTTELKNNDIRKQLSPMMREYIEKNKAI